MTTQLPASTVSSRTFNPIRSIVDSLHVEPNPNKKFISLALGDPTVSGNFKLHQNGIDAVVDNLQNYKGSGYVPSFGTLEARDAISKYYSKNGVNYTPADIVLASGCSDALNLCIGVLANEGDNIILPSPGFALYETLCSSKGIQTRFYKLKPLSNWEIDLESLENCIDQNTRAILLNNPSNPCGSVYSKSHLQEILKIAEKYNLPVISDEIYADMVFKGFTFHALASLNAKVPILTTGGLAKKWLVPGWRVGWILIHDPLKNLDEIRKGLLSLTQLTLGANSLIQAAIPKLLTLPESFFSETIDQLQENAQLASEILSKANGIQIVFPQGAMYLMLKLDLKVLGVNSELEFVESLVSSESVLVLPGSCFRCDGPWVRIVFTVHKSDLKTACDRIVEFCDKYDLSSSTYSPDGRIFQVEYANKAVENSGTAIGIRAKDGIVLAVEKLVPSKLLVQGSNVRIQTVDSHVGMTSAGLVADARHLVNRARQEAKQYRDTYKKPISARMLSERTSQYVQAYTLYGSVRPFGVSAILGCLDEDGSPRLMMIEPSGMYHGYFAVACGKGKQLAKTELEKLNFQELTVQQAVKEAARIIYMVHDDVKDKEFELEMSWACQESNGLHQFVPKQVLGEAERLAKASLQTEMDED